MGLVNTKKMFETAYKNDYTVSAGKQAAWK